MLNTLIQLAGETATPDRSGAIATVVAALIAAGVAVWQTVRANAEKGRATEAQRRLAEGFTAELKKRYGVSGSTLESNIEIVSATGTAEVIRRWSGLTVASTVRVDSIPGRITTDPGSFRDKCTFLPPPLTFAKSVDVEEQPHKPDAASLIFKVVITPAFTASDPPLDFGVQTTVQDAFLMSKQEVDARYVGFKHEYAGLSVEYPIDKLILRVAFGKHLQARAFPIAFLSYDGEVDYPNPDELERIKKGFKNSGDNRGAELVVESPLIGVLYSIFWTPP